MPLHPSVILVISPALSLLLLCGPLPLSCSDERSPPSGQGDDGDAGAGRDCIDADRDGYGQGSDCLGEDLPDKDGVYDANDAIYPGAPEICDGEDNDGNGLVDTEDPGFERDPCPLALGVCSTRGRACVFGSSGSCDVDDYGPDYVEDEQRICDGKDNDCDGEVDEGGCECLDNEVRPCGPCGDGQETCISGAWSECIGGRVPTEEICNGLDEDCDGHSDNGGVCGRCPFYMVYVHANNLKFCIDRWEASREDASDWDPGERSDDPARSRARRHPWVQVPWNLARSACRRQAGRELCSALQWTEACKQGAGRSFPYGDSYEPQACNGADRSGEGLIPTGSLESCSVDIERGIFDLSGNAREWVADFHDDGQRAVLGGSHWDGADSLGCSSQVLIDQHSSEAITGFRCCISRN